MLTQNQIKEHLALAYVYAVAARAGFAVEATQVDMDSIDVRLCSKNDDDEHAVVRSPEIALQVKALPLATIPENGVSFPLKRKNHHDLVKRTLVPRLLVVVVMPEDESEWLSLNENQLILRRCGYWLNLLGDMPTENETRTTVHLPRTVLRCGYRATSDAMRGAAGEIGMTAHVQGDDAETLDWRDLLRYVDARGWARVESRRPDVAIRRKDGAEIVVPVDRDLADFDEALLRAVAIVGRSEARSTDAVIADLRSAGSDVIRFARAAADSGTLSIDEGAALLAGARTAILASACSVARPNERFHRRMTFKDAEALLEGCRLGQTERGSFVMTVLCPTSVPSEQAKDFGRRTTEGLMSSVSKFVALARQGTIEELVPDDGAPPIISANLCEALVAMMTPGDAPDLRISVSWSPIIPPPSVVNTVRIDRDLRPVLEEVANRLHPSLQQSRSELFVGRVVELAGEANDRGELEGEATFVLHVDDALVRARAALDPAAYRLALDAHREQRYVSVQGTLSRKPKISAIEVSTLHLVS